MIQLDARPERPAVLTSTDVQDTLTELREKVTAGGRLTWKDFTGKHYWGHSSIRETLHAYQHGKCCYCERKRDLGEVDVEHFRPRLGVKEAQDHPGYWWLAYEWNNLFLSCKKCNSQKYKGNHFTLMPGSIHVSNENNNYHLERPMLINPELENPSVFIDYKYNLNSRMAYPIGKDPDGRGRETIKILGLDRDVLQEGLFETLESLAIAKDYLCNNIPGDEKYNEGKRILHHKLEFSREHLGFVNYYIEQEGLGIYLDV